MICTIFASSRLSKTYSVACSRLAHSRAHKAHNAHLNKINREKRTSARRKDGPRHYTTIEVQQQGSSRGRNRAMLGRFLQERVQQQAGRGGALRDVTNQHLLNETFEHGGCLRNNR